MKKYSKETAVGVFVLLGLLCVGYLSVKLGNLTMFTSDYYRVEAQFADVTGLKTQAPVQMLGVDVGHVEAIELDQKKTVVLVTMLIRKQYTLHDDAIASVKTSGLIGDKYLKISPGGVGDELGPGGFIMDTEPSIDLESLISKYVFGSVN